MAPRPTEGPSAPKTLPSSGSTPHISRGGGAPIPAKPRPGVPPPPASSRWRRARRGDGAARRTTTARGGRAGAAAAAAAAWQEAFPSSRSLCHPSRARCSRKRGRELACGQRPGGRAREPRPQAGRQATAKDAPVAMAAASAPAAEVSRLPPPSSLPFPSCVSLGALSQTAAAPPWLHPSGGRKDGSPPPSLPRSAPHGRNRWEDCQPRLAEGQRQRPAAQGW